MESITQSELRILERQRFGNFGVMSRELWVRAFDEYNADHSKDRPLGLHCRSCYMKVYKHLKTKMDKEIIMHQPAEISAERILNQKMSEAGTFGWVNEQRSKVLEAMEEYAKLKVEYATRVNN